VKRAALLALLWCASCALGTDRATLELRVLGSASERDLARQRIQRALPGIAPDCVEHEPQADGGTLTIRGTAAVQQLVRDFAAVQQALLAPPAGPGWRLLVRLCSRTETDARWLEWAVVGGDGTASAATRPAIRSSMSRCHGMVRK